MTDKEKIQKLLEFSVDGTITAEQVTATGILSLG